MPQLRADQAAIHASVDGSGLDKNVWTTMDGGDMTATDTKTRPGGMGDEITLGGPRTRSDCTITRQYTTGMLHGLFPTLERLCGNASMSVSWTPLDGDGNTNGETHGISGKLKEVMRGKFDANASEAVFLTLVMSCNSAPTVIS
jgi:hypothetical protein